jgi:hypothetical protein
VNRLQNLELEHKGSHRGRFSVAYCCRLLEQIINALDRWIADLEELIPTIAEECCQRRCFANLAKEYPWDGILVQELVEKRMKLYIEAVKQADGATGQQTEISIPEITQRDLVELISQCPSTDHQDWLFQNVGLRYFSPTYQRIRIGTFSDSRANSSDSNPGVREDLWIKIKPLDTVRPIKVRSLPPYFAANTGLLRAEVFFNSNSLWAKYPDEAIQILAILPSQYVSFLQQLKKDVQNHALQGAESAMRQITSLIARNQHCLCPREDDGSVPIHERGFHSPDKSNDDANLRGLKAILDRVGPAVPGMSMSGRSIVRRDYNDDNYYANIGFAEKDEKSRGYNPLKHRCKETGDQVSKDILGYLTRNPRSSTFLRPFLETQAGCRAVTAAGAEFLLYLAAKGKLSIQDGGYDEDFDSGRYAVTPTTRSQNVVSLNDLCFKRFTSPSRGHIVRQCRLISKVELRQERHQASGAAGDVLSTGSLIRSFTIPNAQDCTTAPATK